MLALEEHFDVEFLDHMLGRKTFGSIRAPRKPSSSSRPPPPPATPRNSRLAMNLARRSIQPAAARESLSPRSSRRSHAIGRDTRAPCRRGRREARFPREAFDALKAEKLLGAYVPAEYGGMGLDGRQVAKMCEALGQYCASTAMIFAMHQIQVACVVHHAQQSPFFRDYLRELVEDQRLIASATTEIGIGGDVRSSICAVEVEGDSLPPGEEAPVISYGEQADDILVTCRSAPRTRRQASRCTVLVRQAAIAPLKPLSRLGHARLPRHVQPGLQLYSAAGAAQQILPTPFADILGRRRCIRFAHRVELAVAGHRDRRGQPGPRLRPRRGAQDAGHDRSSAMRLAEVDRRALQEMRDNVAGHAREYRACSRRREPRGDSQLRVSPSAPTTSSCPARSSIVDIVGRAMLICGIAGYRNDSKY